MSKDTEKAISVQQHEPDLKGNLYAELHEVFANGFSSLGSLLSKIHKAQEGHMVQDVKALVPGNDVTLNFSAMSVYVDNSNNTNEIIISSNDGRITYAIPASTQKWVHPLGGRQFLISGTGSCNAKFVDKFLPL